MATSNNMKTGEKSLKRSFFPFTNISNDLPKYQRHSAYVCCFSASILQPGEKDHSEKINAQNFTHLWPFHKKEKQGAIRGLHCWQTPPSEVFYVEQRGILSSVCTPDLCPVHLGRFQPASKRFKTAVCLPARRVPPLSPELHCERCEGHSAWRTFSSVSGSANRWTLFPHRDAFHEETHPLSQPGTAGGNQNRGDAVIMMDNSLTFTHTVRVGEN